MDKMYSINHCCSNHCCWWTTYNLWIPITSILLRRMESMSSLRRKCLILLKKKEKPIEGYKWICYLYIYIILHKKLWKKFQVISYSEQAVIANWTVYWIDGSYGKKTIAQDGFEYLEYTTHYYYHYTPGDADPIEINIPQNCHLINFATDGMHLAMTRNEVLW